MQSIGDIAQEVGCSHWTIRRYLKRGIVRGFQGNRGKWYLEPGEVPKIRRHLEQHGGPGGRSLIAPS